MNQCFDVNLYREVVMLVAECVVSIAHVTNVCSSGHSLCVNRLRILILLYLQAALV